MSHFAEIDLNVSPAWLNNCVGHFNHRYFFSFCLYMTLGCVYCSISSKDMFLDSYTAIEVRNETLTSRHHVNDFCCEDQCQQGKLLV